MPTDIKTRMHAGPIKWSDEEWNTIAVRLYQLKGSGVLMPEGIEEIRARDVYEAQNVLPEERRRKQISIAQGFQAIRTRLRRLFERGQQENLFPALSPSVEEGVVRSSTPPVTQESSQDAPDKASDSERIAEADLFSEADLVSRAVSGESARMHTPTEGKAVDVDFFGNANVEAVSEKTPYQGVGETSQRVATRATTSAGFPENANAHRSIESHSSAAVRRAGPEVTSLTELARPFVAMVCEELARALVHAFSEQESLRLLSSGLRAGSVQPANRSKEGQPERDKRPLRGEHRPQATFGDRDTKAHSAVDGGDEELGHPAEFQPLFDPKLPPSANSDFKPMIGLVATRPAEYEDLPIQYPQLRFSIVQAESIRGPEAFRNCQRVIGLRDEVPPATDELLKRTLRYRYIRLSGGADTVREQLGAWLNNPGSMQSGPRPHVPRNAKGTGTGNVKKRGKWPPRVA